MNYHFDNVPSQHAAVIHANSRSFSLASRLLPRQMRRQACLLYAWCRWCDDAVDHAATKEEAEWQLDRLRKDVNFVYQGQQPSHQASLWLAEVVADCGIPRDLPLDLLHGMEMDLRDSRSIPLTTLFCIATTRLAAWV